MPKNLPAILPVHKRLSSVQARRQAQHLLMSVLGGLLFALMYVLGTWLVQQRMVSSLFLQTLMWCMVPYLVTVRWLYKTTHLPSTEHWLVLVVNTIVPFLLLVLVLALLQKPFARSALALAAGITVVWFALAERWAQRTTKMQLLVLGQRAGSELAAQLHTQPQLLNKQVELVEWGTDTAPSFELFDGLLLPAQPNLNDDQQAQLARAKQLHMRIYTASSIAELLTGRKSPDVLSNPLWQPDGNPAYDLGKRLVDVMVVLSTAPGWLPLGVLVALAIKLDGPGPAIFSQWRSGKYGRPFKIYKFRTMVVQAESKAQFAQLNDKRITRLGHFLRKSRLDEIPQLVNVLLGHMSLIGPRPEQASFVSQFATDIPSYPYRHLVRPGITGWAQVMQGYAANTEETTVKLSYDLYYVSHYSLALDLLIAVKTVKTMFTGFGAR
jgi:exopolysaccharide biosynthesis polyprenyl glycosylphosphotransferase